MKTPIVPRLGLCLCLVLGGLPGGASARGNDAEAAVKAAEARLRASDQAVVSKSRVVAEPAPAQENFFTKLSTRFARPAVPVKAVPKVVAQKELPTVTVRGSQSGQKPLPRGEGADLGRLVSGILMRLGPMTLEESDDAVMNPSADSLSLLAHPNIQPVIPVAPVPVPGSSRDGAPKYAPNPLTEHRTSWLAAKVAEKLEVMEAVDATALASASREAKPSALPVKSPSESEGSKSREDIELMALLAVSSAREEAGAPSAKMAARTEPESRISALSLLASAAPEEAHADESASKGRRSELRELQRFPGQQLEPIPVIKPAREIESSNRTRVLMLLQPDKLAGAP